MPRLFAAEVTKWPRQAVKDKSKEWKMCQQMGKLLVKPV
jgi:hypothetical protein